MIGRLDVWVFAMVSERETGAGSSSEDRKKGEMGSASQAKTAAQETDYPSCEIGTGKSREVGELPTERGFWHCGNENIF